MSRVRVSHAAPYVRDYLHEQQGGCCAICGIKNEWSGVNLALIIDHIDGDAINICDSQLPTYEARNRGNGRHYRRQRYAAGQSY